MSPPLFLLGLFSIPTVWAITTLGLPSDVWTFGVMPVLSVYILCDETRLREAAVKAPRSRVSILGSVVTVVFAILGARFACVRHILWRLCVLLVWLFCMVKAFDFEKKMYMTDTFGEWAKLIVWNVIERFTGESGRMSYRGEWAYCCPYTRRRVAREIDHYYTLQKQPDEEREQPERFSFSFPIGSCTLECEYAPAEDGARDHYDSASQGELFHLENAQYEGLQGPRDHYNSARQGGLFHMENAQHQGLKEKMNIDTESSSWVAREVQEASSSKRDPVTEDRYILIPSYVNKLQVRLKYGDQILESYEFYDKPQDAVAAMKRVLDTLRDERNIIFSSLNRKIGSTKPRAHARCHEFRELFDLILNQGYKLHAVNLRAKYQCVISDHWSSQVSTVCQVGIMTMINYYQLTQPPDIRVAIGLVVLYALIDCFLILVRCIGQEEFKRFVYFIISRIAPNRLDSCYRYFQGHNPYLTFGNESYGYPYTSSQKQICFLRGYMGALPIMCTDSPKELVLNRLRQGERVLDRLKQGLRVFNLRNLQVELEVTHLSNGENENVETEVRMWRHHDHGTPCYRQYFQTDDKRATSLIALMKWLEDHDCVGVCKEWPKRNLMYAYRYEELIKMVLNEGARPMVTRFWSPLDITVE